MDTSSVGAHLDRYTYQKLLADALAMVPDTLDKRQGSIIYDTLAVSDVQLAEGYALLKGFYLDGYALTARGHYLDLRVAEAGVTRHAATAAVKLAHFEDASGNPVPLPIGTRFSTASDSNALIYVISCADTSPGYYQMTCETVGTAGNDYTGALLPIGYLTGVATATMTDLLIPASDAEKDDALLARYLEAINQPAFGGNVAQYRRWVLDMAGVGAVQVYPVADGGGTVKVSIIGADYNPASTALMDAVQTALDPEENHGMGLGLAPLYHTVSVVTPDKVSISVEANLALQSGVVIEQITKSVNEAIVGYLLE